MVPRPFNNAHLWSKADALFDHASYERQKTEKERPKAIYSGAFQLIRFGDPVPSGPNEVAQELERRIKSTLDLPDGISKERTEKLYAICKTLFSTEPGSFASQIAGRLVHKYQILARYDVWQVLGEAFLVSQLICVFD
jgi:hypothetical protein